MLRGWSTVGSVFGESKRLRQLRPEQAVAGPYDAAILHHHRSDFRFDELAGRQAPERPPRTVVAVEARAVFHFPDGGGHLIALAPTTFVGMIEPTIDAASVVGGVEVHRSPRRDQRAASSIPMALRTRSAR